MHGRNAATATLPHAPLRPPAVGERAPLRVAGVYSDLLYQPWFLGHLEIDPEWLEADTIERRADLSLEDFRRDFELPNRPVVLTGAAAKWPAIGKWWAPPPRGLSGAPAEMMVVVVWGGKIRAVARLWIGSAGGLFARPLVIDAAARGTDRSDDYLEKTFGSHQVLAGEYPMTYGQYRKYMDTTPDEMPLYLFGEQQQAPASRSCIRARKSHDAGKQHREGSLNHSACRWPQTSTLPTRSRSLARTSGSQVIALRQCSPGGESHPRSG